MAFAFPTSPCTSLFTYAEADVMYTGVLGTSAGLISTTEGQKIAEAAEQTYWEIVNCLRKWGYTTAQITLWFAAEGHAVHAWYAAYFWLTLCGVARDDRTFQQADRFRLKWEALCATGGPLFDVTGALLEPDPSATSASYQARASVQNNTLGKFHNNRIDADPRQMLAGSASTIVGNTHYENPAGC